MYYRPRDKKRNPGVTAVLFMLLVGMAAVLVLLLAIYAGYLHIETATLAQQFGPTPTATRPAVLYVGDGDQFFAQGKLPEAINAYEQAIDIDPSDDVPYIRQSRLLVYTGDTARAVDRAAQAVLLNPTSPENLAYYCRALDWEAEYGPAIDACSCAIELAPNYAEGHAFLSEVFADQGQWFAARESIDTALAANFQSMDAHHNLGYVYEVQGRYKEAAESYENAIKLAPNLAPLYVDAGRAYFWLGDVEQAVDRFKRAIRLNPTSADAYDQLGWTYQSNGDYARAIDALEQGLGVDPAYEKAWAHLGIVYYTRRNFEKAIGMLPKAIQLAEGQFLRRAREVEIYAEVKTLTGSDFIPVLRGRLAKPKNAGDAFYTAEIKPVVYKESILNTGGEDSTCADAIVDAINNPSALPLSTEALDYTRIFSQTTGTATLNLTNGNLALDLQHVPRPETTPFELKMRFWPDRTDSIGYVQPDGNNQVQVNIQFNEKQDPPIEYLYTLGLAYAYMDPPMCTEAVPYLLKALERDSGGYNPAWYGLQICPSASSPPTPVPTWTPVPEGQ